MYIQPATPKAECTPLEFFSVVSGQ